MIPVTIKEEKKYSKSLLSDKFHCFNENLDYILNELSKFNIIKFDDLDKIKFIFVGVIIIENYIIYCFPKYLSKYDFKDLKQIIKVIAKINNNGDFINIQNYMDDFNSVNMLPLMLFFIQDYYENGLYNNLQDIVEIDGNGEILWNQTINTNKVIIQDDQPFYYELYTRNRIDNYNDYFRVLHKIILTKCSKDLKEANLLWLFDLTEIELTDKSIENFDNKENILNKINQERHMQFNTRKLQLLEAMYLYISNKNSNLGLKNCFTLYGTSSYYNIWEKLCCYTLNDMKNYSLTKLNLPIPLNEKYKNNNYTDLSSIIETPRWFSFNDNNNKFSKDAKENKLKPDLITIHENESDFYFLIFDAKYYKLQLEENLDLKGQPGIESITKQYLYQLAYTEFIELHKFDYVKNYFLMPNEGSEIICKGYVELKILHELNLENIQIILLPANKINQLFLNNEKLDINLLN